MKDRTTTATVNVNAASTTSILSKQLKTTEETKESKLKPETAAENSSSDQIVPPPMTATNITKVKETPNTNTATAAETSAAAKAATTTAPKTNVPTLNLEAATNMRPKSTEEMKQKLNNMAPKLASKVEVKRAPSPDISSDYSDFNSSTNSKNSKNSQIKSATSVGLKKNIEKTN